MQRFLNVKPLTITLKHGAWSQQKIVKRADYAPDLITQWFNERCTLSVDDDHNVVQERRIHMCALNIKDGSVLEIRIRPDEPAPQDSSC